MDIERFDAWTRVLIERGSRRTILGLLFGSAAGIAASVSSTAAKKKPKPRCQTSGERCGAAKRCCKGEECIGRACCPGKQVFVECAFGCECEDNREFCCAEEASPPQGCVAGPKNNPAFCCPKANVCGDLCCDPIKETCRKGHCTCKPENTCGSTCCDLRFCVCNQELGVCEDAPGQLCPSGGGGFTRVRRLP